MSDAPSHASDDVRDPIPPLARCAQFQRGHTWLIGALLAAIVLSAFTGDDGRLVLRYERFAVLNGESWRLLTGHLVHGNAWHMTLNVAGMGLTSLLFGRDYRPWQWVGILLASVCAIDIGFVFCEPQLAWYVGLSGVLHGAIAAGLIAWWRYESRLLTLAVAMSVIGKLIWEQHRGALPFSGDMPVIVDAHLYGAIGGALGALMLQAFDRYWPRGSRSL